MLVPYGDDGRRDRVHIQSDINACLAVKNTMRSTLGPYSGDLLLVNSNGRQTITNDGATVIKVRRYVMKTRACADFHAAP
jgi:T-complex protein 1 subunit eta